MMNTKGLLVSNEQGQEFLLTTESSPMEQGYEMVVNQKVRNRWVSVDRARAPEIREHLMGALLEFFAGLCRALNNSGRAQKHARAGTERTPEPRQPPLHPSEKNEMSAN